MKVKDKVDGAINWLLGVPLWVYALLAGFVVGAVVL